MEPSHTESVTAEVVPYAGHGIESRQGNQTPSRISFFEMEPAQQVAEATKIANVLKDVIKKQGLCQRIGNKDYVKVDAWILLGNFLGVLPREVSNDEHQDGSFEARVDLVRTSNGIVVGGASALCGMDEKKWSGSDKYARRSMAATRAIGKAYRSSFSWIINLAGYEPTPAEEMPGNHSHADHDKKSDAGSRNAGSQQSASEKVRLYTGDTEQQEKVLAVAKKYKVPEEKYHEVHDKMMGKPGYKLPEILKEMGYVAPTGPRPDFEPDQAG